MAKKMYSDLTVYGRIKQEQTQGPASDDVVLVGTIAPITTLTELPTTSTGAEPTYKPGQTAIIGGVVYICTTATSTGTNAWAYTWTTAGDPSYENVIETVKVEGNALTPDANKAVNVTRSGLGLNDKTVSLNGTSINVQSTTAAGTNLTGVYAPTSAGTSGQYLQSAGSGAPSWKTLYDDKVSLNGSTTKIMTSTSTAVTVYAPTGAGTQYDTLRANASGVPTWEGVVSSSTGIVTGEGKLVTAGAVADKITALGTPMQFKGTVGTSDATITFSNTSSSTYKVEGYTYKAITAGTVNTNDAVQIGDTIIYNGTAWVIIPSGDEPNGTVTSVGADGTYLETNLTNNAPITTTGTISHKTSGVTVGSYGPSANATPAYGDTFNVPYITVNAAGHVTAASTKTVKIPASDNTIGKIVIGASTSATSDATSSAPTTNTTTFLNHVENSAVQSHHQIKGAGATSVAFDSTNGLVITSTDTNTHYTAVPVLGGSTATSNATSDTANTATYLNIVENSSKSGGVQIKGAGATSVSAKNGVLTITSTDSDTHYTANLITGDQSTDKTTQAGGTNSVYLNLVENDTVRDSHQIVGSGTTTVASDANGKITITSADQYVGTVTGVTAGTGLSGGTISTSGTLSLAATYQNQHYSGTVTVAAAADYTISNIGFAPKIVQVYDASGNEVEVAKQLGATSVTLTTSMAITSQTWTVNIIGW